MEGKTGPEASKPAAKTKKTGHTAMPPKPPKVADKDPVNWLALTVEGVIVKVLQRGSDEVMTLGRTGRGKGSK